MKFSKYILLITVVFLLISISFVSSTTKQNCPILGAYYYDRFENYYECIDPSATNKILYYNRGIGWYTSSNDDKKFDSIGGKDMQDLTTREWIQNRLRAETKDKQVWIEGEGLMLQEISNETIKLNFVEEGCFFRLHDDIFTNIVPISTSFVEFDYINKEVISANFVVEKDGGSYTFGDNSFYAPPNSRIIFDKKTGIEINIKDGTDLTDMSDLFKFNTGYPITIKGENIEFPNGLDLTDGEVTIDNRGYILRQGKLSYWQNLFVVDEKNNQLLIANKNVNLSNYKENWMKQTDNILRLQSSENRLIDMKFLGETSMLIKNGDSLEIETNNLELPPIISHFSSDKGETIIGRFAINKNSLSMDPHFQENENHIAFELKPNSPSMTRFNLQVNPSGQFEILSKDGEKIVSYNKYQLA